LPTPGAATSSQLGGAYDVAVDASGDVYVADAYDSEVEKVTPAGQLSVIAGTGTFGTPTAGTATSSRLNDPTGVAVDAAGDVYIADYQNDVVEKLTPSGQLSIFAGEVGNANGTPTQGSATATAIGQPFGVAVDGAGNVYISASARLYKVTPSGQLSFYAGNGTTGTPTPGMATSSPLGAPAELAVDSAGDLFAADPDANEKVTPGGMLSIVAGNGTSGVPVPGPATSSPLYYPTGIAVDAAGDLYIADNGNEDVEEVTPGGMLSVIAGDNSYGTPTYGVPATSSSLAVPYDVAVTPAGRVYIADTDNSTIDLLAPPITANTAVPVITGTAAAGDALTASTGTWTNSPVIYTYQWEDCDSSGLNCTVITGATASTYSVTAADAGHTIRVIVTAQNGGGSASATSAQTAVVPSPPVSTPPVPSPPVSTPPTTGTGSSTTSAVSIPSQTVSAGLNLTASGGVTVPVSCSAGDGCQASVTFTIERSVITPGAGGTDTIAQVPGTQISAGVTSYLKAKLSAAALRGLQASGARRVNVTVTITNSDGTVGTQQLWLNLPAGLDVCPAPTGRITGTTLGPISSGKPKRRLTAAIHAISVSGSGFIGSASPPAPGSGLSTPR
jgi:hypothetical protein